MWLSCSSLRGYLGAAAPWFLAVLCGSSTGPGLTRALSLRHLLLTNWSLVLWARLPRSFSCPPPPSHGMSRLGVRVCLHVLKCCLYYFLEILDDFFGISRSFLGNVLIPSLPHLLVSSCPGSYGRVGGSAGLCLHPPPSMAPDPQWLLS